MLILMAIIELVIIMLLILGIVVITLKLNNSVIELEEYVNKTFLRLWLFLMLIGIMSINII